MKKSKQTINAILFVAALMFAISCGQYSENKHDNDKASSETVEENHHATDIGLSLDNGKPWIANPETTTGIENMIKLTKSFTDKESLEAFANLNKELVGEFNEIFKQCTMTGEAHNQLHNYLHPLKGMIDSVGSSDIETCRKSFDKLQKHLAEYSKYFVNE
ncbi:MAG: DUF3347 domain-containing protein [Chlorobi bacterium]|nr:DUF3347 domain-containing protein [Chlorobiota bacterium]